MNADEVTVLEHGRRAAGRRRRHRRAPRRGGFMGLERTVGEEIQNNIRES